MCCGGVESCGEMAPDDREGISGYIQKGTRINEPLETRGIGRKVDPI